MKSTARQGAVCVALACLLTLLLQKSFLVQSDEGFTLGAAWQLWNGMKMYDDFRLFVAPGSGYAVFFVWKLCGAPSFLAARVLSLLLSFSSIAAVYLILARRGIGSAGLALTLVAWVIASAQYVPLNHNAFSSYLATWMLLLLLRAQQRDREGGPQRLSDHALVGVAGGAVLVFLQTKGLLLIAASAGFTLLAGWGKRGLRAAAAVVVGALVVVAPLLLVWRPSVLVREWFINPVTGDYLGHTGAAHGLAIACLLVTAVMAAIALRLRDRLLIAVAVFQAALVASTLHNPEFHHVAVNAFPLLVFVPLALQRRAAGKPAPTVPAQSPPSASIIMALVVGMFAILLATPPGRPIWRQSPLYVDFIRRPSRNLFPQPRVAAAHAIYAGPFMPGLYYALGKPNPLFLSETTVCNDDACQRRLRAQIETLRPEIAFLDYQMIRHLGLDENSPVDTYFRERYVKCPNADYDGLIVRAIDPSWCP